MDIIFYAALFLSLAPLIYLCVALLGGFLWRPCKDYPPHKRAPVSILKPLHGDEPNLYENLRTFCVQDYPRYQILFGVHRADDPAGAVGQRLQAEFPQLDIQLVVDARHYGVNPKINNLINLRERAKYEWLVIADSDICVERDYLEAVTSPLNDPNVGVVTCVYRAKQKEGLWARLGAAFVNDWFAPSVHISLLLRLQAYCAGATMAMRASVLEQIGGFAAVKDQLADDYWIGKLCRERGLKTVVAAQAVTTDINMGSLQSMWQQELRWMRTTKCLTPICFGFLFVTMTTPLLWLALLLSPSIPMALIVALGMASRSILHFRQNPFRVSDVLLIPLRDTLLIAEWLVAFMGATVMWRGQKMQAEGSGSDRVTLLTP